MPFFLRNFESQQKVKTSNFDPADNTEIFLSGQALILTQKALLIP